MSFGLGGTALVTATIFKGDDFPVLKIFPRKAKTAAPARPTTSSNTSTTAAGNFFSGAATPPAVAGTEVFFSVTFEPVRMNFWSSDAGACGTVIFWKHVGQSITEPACDESHLMCWPHTGQAYLNSLMPIPEWSDATTFHIRAPLATRFSISILLVLILESCFHVRLRLRGQRRGRAGGDKMPLRLCAFALKPDRAHE